GQRCIDMCIVMQMVGSKLFSGRGVDGDDHVRTPAVVLERAAVGRFCLARKVGLSAVAVDGTCSKSMTTPLALLRQRETRLFLASTAKTFLFISENRGSVAICQPPQARLHLCVLFCAGREAHAVRAIDFSDGTHAAGGRRR
ncbi:MAG TPA: hypothetical protein VFY63_04480, partial [Pseudorhizobium sp.]|nr:hypothetical protein [Pseudorhizobium sp.]